MHIKSEPHCCWVRSVKDPHKPRTPGGPSASSAPPPSRAAQEQQRREAQAAAVQAELAKEAAKTQQALALTKMLAEAEVPAPNWQKLGASTRPISSQFSPQIRRPPPGLAEIGGNW